MYLLLLCSLSLATDFRHKRIIIICNIDMSLCTLYNTVAVGEQWVIKK